MGRGGGSMPKKDTKNVGTNTPEGKEKVRGLQKRDKIIVLLHV
jgi:hypothetical protein